MSDDISKTGAIIIVAIIVIAILWFVAIVIIPPIIAIYILVKGWNNAGWKSKAAVFLLPVFALFSIFDPDTGADTLAILLISVTVSWGLALVAYAKVKKWF